MLTVAALGPGLDKDLASMVELRGNEVSGKSNDVSSGDGDGRSSVVIITGGLQSVGFETAEFVVI